jgi:hypothetical protein
MVAAAIGTLAVTATSQSRYYLDCDTDLSRYRKRGATPVPQLNRYRNIDLPWGVWLESEVSGSATLYQFDSTAFLQGVVSWCRAAQLDPRSSIIGAPFDRRGQRYDLRGYRLAPSLTTYVVSDTDDEEVMEAEDENILEPLTKDY